VGNRLIAVKNPKPVTARRSARSALRAECEISGLAGEPTAGQIMALRQRMLEPAHCLRGDEPHRHAIQPVAFARNLGRLQAASLGDGRKKVQSRPLQ